MSFMNQQKDFTGNSALNWKPKKYWSIIFTVYAKDSEQADGQAVSTETVFIEDNMDKILEKLTALQRKID